MSYAREMAQIEVQDTGPGMDAAELDRVFEPFARGAQGVSEQTPQVQATAGGTGLGLTIAKMLTDLMGGELKVRSTPGVGTVFTVRLLLSEVHGAVVRKHAAPAFSGYEGPRRRVLVVDNEEADRELLQRWLSPLGFEVLLATSGHDALALLEGMVPGSEQAPHAIFLDLAMPGIDGWETLRRLRSRGWGALPLAVVSANAFDKGLATDSEGAAVHSPPDFFVKPVRREDLLDWLGGALGLAWTEAAHTTRASTEGVLPSGVAAGAAPSLNIAPDELLPLLELARLGYYRGIVQWLDRWLAQRPEHSDFAHGLRTLAREFRFEAIEQRLLPHCPSATSLGSQP